MVFSKFTNMKEKLIIGFFALAALCAIGAIIIQPEHPTVWNAVVADGQAVSYITVIGDDAKQRVDDAAAAGYLYGDREKLLHGDATNSIHYRLIRWDKISCESNVGTKIVLIVYTIVAATLLCSSIVFTTGYDFSDYDY